MAGIAGNPTLRRPRWYVPTPVKFLFAVLVMQGVLLLSAHYRWFWFNERKGYTVLITVAATAIALLLLIGAVVVSRFFKAKYQFTLATLLLMVPVMAIPLGWLAREMELSRRQKSIVEELFQHLTMVYFDDYTNSWGMYVNNNWEEEPPMMEKVEKWVACLLGEDFFRDVEDVQFLFSHGEQFQIKRLSIFEKMRSLDMGNVNVTRENLTDIGNLTQLQKLSLKGAPIGDDSLETLRGLTNLRELLLEDTQVTDLGVQSLQKSLPNCQITR